MKLYPTLSEFQEGRGYTREQWEEDDNPEWTDEELKTAKPLSQMPQWLKDAVEEAVVRKRGERGKQKAPTKVYVNIGFDRDIIDKFKEGGRGWQTRINEALKQSLALNSKA